MAARGNHVGVLNRHAGNVFDGDRFLVVGQRICQRPGDDPTASSVPVFPAGCVGPAGRWGVAVAARLVSVVPWVNANRARAKRGGRQVPLPATVLRLYADYLHGEYAEMDSNYVFVNFWSGPIGCPLTYANVYDLVCRLRERTGITFGPHSFHLATRTPQNCCAATYRWRW